MERRSYTAGDLEVREHEGSLRFVGHAAVFDSLSLPLGGFREQVARGAFRKTIREADVRFLAQHDPATVMARTKAGTLRLKEDGVGLLVEADLNPADPDVQRLAVKVRDGHIDQMSFGFEVIKDEWEEQDIRDEWTNGPIPVRTLKEVRLWDVSPVTFPAYPATDGGLREILVPAEVRQRALRTAIASHSTEVVDEPWDGPAAVAEMPNDPAVLRYCHAWVDSAGDPEEKQSYKFPHHRALDAPAVISAVRNALARLPLADIPENDRAGVERHLRRHLEDWEQANQDSVREDGHRLQLARMRLELARRRIPPL
jgi:HK97 family phage prohead protease